MCYTDLLQNHNVANVQTNFALRQKAAPCTMVIKLKLMQCVYAANMEEFKLNTSVYNRPYVHMYNKNNAIMTISCLAITIHLEGYI